MSSDLTSSRSEENALQSSRKDGQLIGSGTSQRARTLAHKESRGRLAVINSVSFRCPTRTVQTNTNFAQSKPVHSIDDVDFSKNEPKIEISNSQATGDGKKKVYMFDMKVCLLEKLGENIAEGEGKLFKETQVWKFCKFC